MRILAAIAVLRDGRPPRMALRTTAGRTVRPIADSRVALVTAVETAGRGNPSGRTAYIAPGGRASPGASPDRTGE